MAFDHLTGLDYDSTGEIMRRSQHKQNQRNCYIVNPTTCFDTEPTSMATVHLSGLDYDSAGDRSMWSCHKLHQQED